MISETIDFVRKNEGNYYGPGAADLIADLCTAMQGVTDRERARDVVYDVCRKHSAAIGQNPDIEVVKRDNDMGCDWWVAWESGPYDWAIQASMILPVFCEPYYGFDLCFYRND